MKDINIYIMGISFNSRAKSGIAETDLDCPCDEDTYNAMIGSHPFIVADNFCPSFDAMIKWDVGSISSEFVLWMTEDDAQPGSTSLVGILSSSAFENMISKFVDRSLSKHVRLLVKLTSLLYSREGQASYAGCDSTSLWSLRSFAGTRVLQELEPALGTPSLSIALLEKLTALFLVLFATIIAVGYSKPRRPSGDLDASTFGLPVYQSPISTESCTSDGSAQAFSEAQEHLLRILAHHMVYIAERINLLEPKVSRKRIIEGSACRWNRRATFRWNEMPALKDADNHTNLVSSYDVLGYSGRADRTSPAGCPARCYHLSRTHSPKPSCRLTGGFGTCVHEESLNVEMSPMDHILASFPQMTLAPLDVRARGDRTGSGTRQTDLASIQLAPHLARGCVSDDLPLISANNGKYAAFECLAEMDGMCAPFLCTDDDDDIHDDEVSSVDETPTLTTSPTSLQSSFSTAPRSRPSTGHQDSRSTFNTNSDQGSVCRSCKFAALPFDTLDQDDLCQFCSALPQHGGDDVCALPSSDLLDQGALTHGQLDWPSDEYESVNLLV